jgi:hypothetical protein
VELLGSELDHYITVAAERLVGIDKNGMERLFKQHMNEITRTRR